MKLLAFLFEKKLYEKSKIMNIFINFWLKKYMKICLLN